MPTPASCLCGAGRSLGYVCAPSLFQQVIARCADAKVDIEVYRENRDLLYNSLCEYGYDCVKPDGAFYLFVKALEDDAYAFYEKAKAHEILVVPCDDFGVEAKSELEQNRRSAPAKLRVAEKC